MSLPSVPQGTARLSAASNANRAVATYCRLMSSLCALDEGPGSGHDGVSRASTGDSCAAGSLLVSWIPRRACVSVGDVCPHNTLTYCTRVATDAIIAPAVEMSCSARSG